MSSCKFDVVGWRCLEAIREKKRERIRFCPPPQWGACYNRADFSFKPRSIDNSKMFCWYLHIVGVNDHYKFNCWRRGLMRCITSRNLNFRCQTRHSENYILCSLPSNPIQSLLYPFFRCVCLRVCISWLVLYFYIYSPHTRKFMFFSWRYKGAWSMYAANEQFKQPLTSIYIIFPMHPIEIDHRLVW